MITDLFPDVVDKSLNGRVQAIAHHFADQVRSASLLEVRSAKLIIGKVGKMEISRCVLFSVDLNHTA